MKHLTILNPHAGSYSPREHDRIARALSGLEGKVIATPDLSSLDLELQRHQTYQPDVLGIGGGDGTVSHTLTQVQRLWGYIPSNLAVYAMGTMNNVAVPLGACGGLYDTLKRYVGLDTKPVRVAQYIGRSSSSLHTESLAPMNINGRLGFNVGFGTTAKMVWMYYGKSMEQFYAGSQQSEQQKSGMMQVAGLLVEAFRALCNSSSAASQFFNQPLDAAIYIDGQKIEPATGIYLASYEQQNTGIFRAIPSPGARRHPGQMEVVLSRGSIQDVILSLPSLMRGKPGRNMEYIQAKELRIESDKTIIAQVDGEFLCGREFEIRPDAPLKFISLLNH